MDPIIDEISDEIAKGDAHLLTRNELAEFVQWFVNEGDANAMIYDAMEHSEGQIPEEIRNDLAKRFFIEKGYEK